MLNDFKTYIRTKPKRSLLWLVLICLFVSHAISSNNESKRQLLRQYQIAGLANPVSFGGVFQEQLPGGRSSWLAWLGTGAHVGHVYTLPMEVSLDDLQQHYCKLFLSMGWYELTEESPNYYSCSEILPKGQKHYALGFCEGPYEKSSIKIVLDGNDSLLLTVEASYRGSAAMSGCG